MQSVDAAISEVRLARGELGFRDGFFPGATAMISERPKSVSPETRHQVMAGGAMKSYGLN